MKSIFEEMGGTYRQEGDYLVPNLELDAVEGTYGVWGMRHRKFLRENDKVRFYSLMSSGKLHQHLTEVDVRAEKLFEETVKRLAEKEGLTEKVKKKEQMEWVRKMNNVRNRAMEIVNKEVIFV